MSNITKATWIADQMADVTADDVYDVLLGNITRPRSFVAEVESLSVDYDNLRSAGESRRLV